MRYGLILLAVAGGAGLMLPRAFAQTTPAAAPAAPAAGGQTALPPGPGHDTMVKVCSGCHDPAIAAQQRLSHDGWVELVNTMAARGAPATDAQLDEITTYLAASFPEGAPKP
jgi:competence protein ComEA